MSAIKNKDTKPERWLRKVLFQCGFRYRKNVTTLPGKPDIVIPKYQAVIFVHGCFWHMHDCSLFKLPATRTDFWQEKLSGNKRRDEVNLEKLLSAGWRVCVVHECVLKGKNKIQNEILTTTIANWIKSDERIIDIETKFK